MRLQIKLDVEIIIATDLDLVLFEKLPNGCKIRFCTKKSPTGVEKQSVFLKT